MNDDTRSESAGLHPAMTPRAEEVTPDMSPNRERLLLVDEDHFHSLTVASRIAREVVIARGYATVLNVEQLIDRIGRYESDPLASGQILDRVMARPDPFAGITVIEAGENAGDPSDITIHLRYGAKVKGKPGRKGQIAHYQLRVPALLIPVWWAGHIVSHRLRPNTPRISDNKPIKYEQPSGLPIHLDANPLAWEAICDPSRPLAITEGEKKADSLWTAGVAAIGLTGVWCWQKDKKPLREWADVPLTDREVHVVFDSDTTTNSNVMQALTALTDFLRTRGAKVHWTIPPAGTNGEKLGVDDLFAAGWTWQHMLSLSVDPPVNDDGKGSTYTDVEPWPDPIDGVALLNELVDFFAGPAVLPKGGHEACALYTIVTYIADMLEICPYLNPKSAVKRSGKTVIATLLSYVVQRPFMTANATPAAIFRECDAHHPTMIIDEGDSFIGLSDELRNVLNAGFDRNQYVVRAERRGNLFVPMRFSPFGPKIIAGIGSLPDTVADRCVSLEMQRKRPTDEVEKFRRRERRDYRERGRQLQRKIVRWVRDNWDALDKAEPEPPSVLDDRAVDNWEPLLMVADVAGGKWPERARTIAVSLSVQRHDTTEEEILLRDVMMIFHENRAYEVIDRNGQYSTLPGHLLTPRELTSRLTALEERPWQAYGPRQTPINPDQVGKLLGKFGIKSQMLRVANQTPRRLYWKELFSDAWDRHQTCIDCDQEWMWNPPS